MRVERLRPLPSPEALAAMYPVPHDHRLYGRGHGERVEATIALALEHIPTDYRDTVADLSCGNGEIARRIWAGGELHLGDFAVLPAELEATAKYHGSIEQTLDLLPTNDPRPGVGTFVLSETLEHVDDPMGLLQELDRKTEYLVLSTPLECWDDDNPEHLWAWDREGVEQMASEHYWSAVAFTSVDSREYGETYLYGIWVFA